MSTTTSTTTAVWNGHPSQYPMGQLPTINPGQYASTQAIGWPNLPNPYVPAGVNTTSSTSAPIGTFNNYTGTGTSYMNPYSLSGNSYGSYISGISFPPVDGEAIVEKLPPIKNIRSIDEPFVPSCEQT